MFRAVGIGGKLDPKGDTVTIKVRFEDDRTKPPKTLIEEQMFSGPTITSVLGDVQRQLVTMKRNEEDATINDQIAGKVIASV